MENLFESLTPQNEAVLWRFMDLFKFVDLITSRKLILVNLTGMKDPYEGILHSEIGIQWVDLNGEPTEKLENRNLIENLHNAIRETHFISCWHENEFESAGMWDSYGNENGIAIKTTVEKLKNSIQIENYKEMDLLQVNYYSKVDEYFIPNRKENHVYTNLLNKRISFEHEKEVRLIWHPRDYGNKSIIRKIDVDINQLIESIYVSPLYSSWQLNTIKELLNKIGFNIPVIKSDLYDLK